MHWQKLIASLLVIHPCVSLEIFLFCFFTIAFEHRLFGYGEGDCNISASTDTILD